MLLSGREDADPLSFLVFGAGHQLEPADLFAGERGAGEGVVLARLSMCQAITGSLRATARVGCWPPGGPRIRSWKARSGPGARAGPGRFDEHVPALARS